MQGSVSFSINAGQRVPAGSEAGGRPAAGRQWHWPKHSERTRSRALNTTTSTSCLQVVVSLAVALSSMHLLRAHTANELKTNNQAQRALLSIAWMRCSSRSFSFCSRSRSAAYACSSA